MCIRDRPDLAQRAALGPDPGACAVGWYRPVFDLRGRLANPCLLYTSDAADERSSVDLGGRRIIKKKKTGNDVEFRQVVSRRSIQRVYNVQ